MVVLWERFMMWKLGDGVMGVFLFCGDYVMVLW